MPRLLNHEQRGILLEFLRGRFGIEPTTFDPWDIYAFSRQCFLFRRQAPGFKWPQGHFVRCGLPFLRNVAGYLKPTTVFVQRFGHLATKNRLEMDLDQLHQLCANGDLEIKDQSAGLETGYIIILYKAKPLGTSLLLEEKRMVCRLPKAMRQALTRLTPEDIIS